VETVARVMGIPFEDLCEVTGDRLGQDARYWLDSSAIKRDVGWEAEIGLEEGIHEMVGWGREDFDQLRDWPTDYTLRAWSGAPRPPEAEEEPVDEFAGAARDRARDAADASAHPPRRAAHQGAVRRAGDALPHPFQHRPGGGGGRRLCPPDPRRAGHVGPPEPRALSRQGR